MPVSASAREDSIRFQRIYVEIGNSCNLQCSFCPEVERSKAHLALEDFRRILEAVKPYTERICFHVMGEPLSHPLFATFVEEAGKIEVPVEITTNGTLLREETIQALLHPIICQVNFSLQSFLDNYPNANPTRYLQQIFDFCHKALQERPDLYLNLRLWNLDSGSREDTANRELLGRIAEAFAVEVNPRVDVRLRKSKRLLGRLYLHYDSRFEWPHSSQPKLGTEGTCYGTRSHLAIHAEGTVIPCCLDKEARIPLGNIKETSFATILASSRLQAMRQGFMRGEFVEDLCQRCTYARRFTRKR